MSTEVKKEGETAPDEIKNLKAEFSRKMQNIEQTNNALKSSQEALLAEIQKLTKPAPKQEEQGSLSDLMYRDPEAYARRVAEESDRRAEARINQALQNQSRQQQMIGSLVDQFPELNSGEHDMTKRAVEIFNNMAEADKTSPTAYKTAVLEAAAEFGIKPRSKRPKEEEYVGGASGSGTRQSSRRKNELDPRTEEFAKLVGLDPSKAEVKERLINNHGRDSYLKWK